MPPNMTDLTVPSALQALIHADNGQPFQRFAPARLSAAAELCELTIRRSAVIEGDKIVSAHIDTTGPDWIASVSASLASAVSRRSVPVTEWLRRRPNAYTQQRDAAVTAGVLTTNRKKLLGLFPYSSMAVDPTVRSSVLTIITTPRTPIDERAAALASIVTGSGLAGALKLDDNQSSGLKTVAAQATAHGAATPLGSMSIALAAVAYVVVTGS